MEEIILKKEEKETLCDCIVYLLHLCDRYEKDNQESIFCLDIARKALFLYNLSPKSFGNKSKRKEWFETINKRISKYESDERYYVKNTKV